MGATSTRMNFTLPAYLLDDMATRIILLSDKIRNSTVTQHRECAPVGRELAMDTKTASTVGAGIGGVGGLIVAGPAGAAAGAAVGVGLGRIVGKPAPKPSSDK